MRRRRAQRLLTGKVERLQHVRSGLPGLRDDSKWLNTLTGVLRRVVPKLNVGELHLSSGALCLPDDSCKRHPSRQGWRFCSGWAVVKEVAVHGRWQLSLFPSTRVLPVDLDSVQDQRLRTSLIALRQRCASDSAAYEPGRVVWASGLLWRCAMSLSVCLSSSRTGSSCDVSASSRHLASVKGPTP